MPGLPDHIPTPDQQTSARREFLRRWAALGTSAAALLGAGLPLSGCKSSQAHTMPHLAFEFLHGVASGDPLSDRVILWTRITPRPGIEIAEELNVSLQWQIAYDREMREICASGSVQTSQEQDFTVKVDAAGLQPGQVYYYRFLLAPEAPMQATGLYSAVGRSKTLPAKAAGVRQVKLAVVSCSNYPAGYFNVYAACAAESELDAVLHLGDYIYEYEADGYACDDAEKLGRVSQPASALMHLQDYRQRYAQYRTDPHLQALHAQAPMIAVWDDHEFADDAWRDGAGEHDASSQGPFSLRRKAAMTAYHEWLPIRTVEAEQIYRSFDFGQLLSLHMLDTRMIGRDQQLQFASYRQQNGEFDFAKLKREARAAKRQMLGEQQFAWLKSAVEASSARWQVLGQQVLMARMEYPLPVALGEIDRFRFAEISAKANTQQALSAAEKIWLNAPRVPCYLDSWDGYQAERERVFALMRQKNLVVLAGDTHNAWASDLQDQFGRAVGVEFATAAVSSPGLECSFPKVEANQVASCMREMLPQLRYAQTSMRGYMLITATEKEVRCDWRFVDTVHSQNFKRQAGHSLRVAAGKKHLQEI